MGSEVQGEDVETFPKDSYKLVEPRIVGGGKGTGAGMRNLHGNKGGA